MQEKGWFSSSLDIVAILFLAGAVIALGSVFWLAGAVSELLLLKIFHSCLAFAILSFSVSRLAEIFRVISHTPAPKLQRSEVGVDGPISARDSVPADGTNVVTDGKFPRAA